MPYVPPYQGFTLVFFINLLLFFFVYLTFLLYSHAYWQQVIFSVWYVWDPPTSGQVEWRGSCYYYDIPKALGPRYKWSLKLMCTEMDYIINVLYLVQALVGSYCSFFVLYLIFRFTRQKT